MSLMPLRRSNGQIAVDVGYYYPMSTPAQHLNLECVRSKGQGGFTYVGMWIFGGNLAPISSAAEEY